LNDCKHGSGLLMRYCAVGGRHLHSCSHPPTLLSLGTLMGMY
jgi:hypothetical protein